jgi:hypothetical protein
MISGYLYEISVYNSVGDFIHGMPQSITEVGIPEYGISFNCHNDNVSVFKYTEERHKLGEDIKTVEMTKEFIDNLIKIKNLHDELNILKDNNKIDILNLTKK